LDISLRPVTKADFEFVRSTHHVAYRDVVTRQWGQWDDKMQDEFFLKGWGAGETDVIVVDGMDCGYTSVVHRDADVLVRKLVIHPDCQGRGIGSRFLRGVLTKAARHGVPVRLNTCIENHRAQAFYSRLGFREVGRTESHVCLEALP